MARTGKRKNITYFPRPRRNKNCQENQGSGHAVIAVVGAGGKTTYIEENARKLAAEGKRVAVTTSTHIYDPHLTHDISHSWDGDERKPVARIDNVDYFGVPCEDGKLGPVSQETFHEICSTYDYVFTEADGSHGMPAKIPVGGEPVIPGETTNIVVIMGRAAVGRSPFAVCQHYPLVRDSWIPEHALLTEDHLRRIAFLYYIQPLRRKYPQARCTYLLSDMYRTGYYKGQTDVTFVLMASGFGRRFGGNANKLLTEYHGERLFQYALNNMIQAAELLKQYRIRVTIDVVTRYPEIMDYTVARRLPNVRAYFNTIAQEGITSSIRIGTRTALAEKSQAVIFFAADMPSLAPLAITRFIWEFICSGKTYGCMAYRSEKAVPGAFDPAGREGGKPIRVIRKVTVTPTVPGAFRLTRKGVAEEILSIRGDHGAMRIIKKKPWDTYLYYIERRFVADVDYKV